MIEAMPAFRRIPTIGTVTIQQTRRGVRQVAVPDLVGIFGQRVASDLMPARGLEQAELDPFSMCREHGEIDAKPIPRRTERIRMARQQRIRQMVHASKSIRGTQE